MKLKEWLKKHGFQGKPEVREASGTYEGTDVPVNYIRLDNAVDGCDFILISYNMYEDTLADPKALQNASVVMTDFGWKAQRADGSKLSELKFDWD